MLIFAACIVFWAISPFRAHSHTHRWPVFYCTGSMQITSRTHRKELFSLFSHLCHNAECKWFLTIICDTECDGEIQNFLTTAEMIGPPMMLLICMGDASSLHAGSVCWSVHVCISFILPEYREYFFWPPYFPCVPSQSSLNSPNAASEPCKFWP